MIKLLNKEVVSKNVAINICSKYLYGRVFSFLLGKFTGVEWLRVVGDGPHGSNMRKEVLSQNFPKLEKKRAKE